MFFLFTPSRSSVGVLGIVCLALPLWMLVTYYISMMSKWEPVLNQVLVSIVPKGTSLLKFFFNLLSK